MKQDVEQILDDLNETLKSNEGYEKYDIEYVLVDPNDNSKSFAIAAYGDEIVSIDIETKEISDVAYWAYNVDDDILGELEDGKEIAYMTSNCHYGIFQVVEETYPEELEHFMGLQKYLDYCKANNITRETIDKETGFDDTPDIMKYFEDKEDIQQDKPMTRMLDKRMHKNDKER